MPADWEELLDQLDECNAGVGAALEEGTRFPLAPLLPGSLGSLPEELVPRVQNVLEELAKLEAKGWEVRNRIANFLALNSGDTFSSSPVYLDKSA